jgi:hypothetical protein
MLSVFLLLVAITAASTVWTPQSLAAGKKSAEQQGQGESEMQRAQDSSVSTEFGTEETKRPDSPEGSEGAMPKGSRSSDPGEAATGQNGG